MEKNKMQRIDEIMQGVDNINHSANTPDEVFLDALKSRLHTRLSRQSKMASKSMIWAMAASFTLLLAANFLVAGTNPSPHSDRVETLMRQDGIYPVIPFETF